MPTRKRDSEDNPGVLVISIWHEAGMADGFRSRLIASGGVEADTTTAYATSPKEVIEVVQDWLDRMATR